MYKLTTYIDGRATGTGEYDEPLPAVQQGVDALFGTFNCDEFEVTTDIKGRNTVIAYAFNEDRAAERGDL